MSAMTIAELTTEYEAITAKTITNLRAEYEERIQVLSKMIDKLAKPSVVLVGSKFKWVSDSQNYRTAIMTSKGLLQVKSVTNGLVESDTSRTIGGTHPLIKKLFADETEWRASLPQGGNIELSLPEKIAPSQRNDTLFTPGMSDVEKVDALIKRYKIWHRVIQHRSPKQCLDDAVTRLDYFCNTLNKLSYDEMLQQELFTKNRGMQYLLCAYSHHRKRVAEAGDNADKPPFHYGRQGTGSIHVMINGQEHFITTFEGKIAAVAFNNYWGAVTFYKDFAEMGNPAISVLYRKRVINI